jgi:hypothetical protein
VPRGGLAEGQRAARRRARRANAARHPARDNPEWQLTVVSSAAPCHDDKLKTYRDTFTGRRRSSDSARSPPAPTATGNHRILPASDPASPIRAGEPGPDLRKCHANASPSFVKYDPHADKHNRERNAGCFYASKMMQSLLFFTFGFFGLHTAACGSCASSRSSPLARHAGDDADG